MEPAKYQARLGQMLAEGQRFVGEGGIETFVIFKKHLPLPCFASFQLYASHPELIREWHGEFYGNARQHGLGYWLGTNTWRANPDWGEKLQCDLDESWKAAVEASLRFRAEVEEPTQSPIVICGVVGPRRDGYLFSKQDTVLESQAYHARQIKAMKQCGVDVISAYTMTHAEEACGIVLAARECKMPVTISFTVETDGLLPNGKTLRSALEELDRATDRYALFYMVNCAHPSHLRGALAQCQGQRLRGFMPNSSKRSHAELDESTELDEGEPEKLGDELFAVLREHGFANPSVVAGCCGTGMEHLHSLTKAFCSE